MAGASEHRPHAGRRPTETVAAAAGGLAHPRKPHSDPSYRGRRKDVTLPRRATLTHPSSRLAPSRPVHDGPPCPFANQPWGPDGPEPRHTLAGLAAPATPGSSEIAASSRETMRIGRARQEPHRRNGRRKLVHVPSIFPPSAQPHSLTGIGGPSAITSAPFASRTTSRGTDGSTAPAAGGFPCRTSRSAARRIRRSCPCA